MTYIESAAATLPEVEEPQACCSQTKQNEHQQAQHDQQGHGMHHEHHQAAQRAASLNRTAFMATLHCLTGCTIGEVLGMVEHAGGGVLAERHHLGQHRLRRGSAGREIQARCDRALQRAALRHGAAHQTGT